MLLAHAIFTDSQARLYKWLFGQPDRSYHLSELRRLTGLGSASLQRELKRLVDANLILSSRHGNLRSFKANPKHAIFSDLVSLTKKTLGVVPLLRQALAPLTPKLQAAWVYGSVAKQTDTSHSDIDVLLVGQDLLLSEVLELLIPLESELGRKINPNCYSTIEFQKRRAEPDSFVNRVLAQPLLPLTDINNASA